MGLFKAKFLSRVSHLAVASITLVALLGYASVPVVQASTTTVYRPTFVDLGLLNNGTYSQATGVATNGQVVGDGDTSVSSGGTLQTHAFYWNPTGGGLHDVNSEIVGASCPATPADICDSYATGINNKGEMTGYAVGSISNTFGYVLSTGGTSISASIPNFQPAAINDNGIVVGQDQNNLSDPLPAKYNGTSLVDLPTVPGETSGNALGINDKNQIVGEVTTTTPASPSNTTGEEAVVWAAPTTGNRSGIIVLDNTNFDGSSEATGINENSVIVGSGTSSVDSGQNDPFEARFSTTGAGSVTVMTNLSTGGGQAVAISSNYHITGNVNSNPSGAVWASYVYSSPTAYTGLSAYGTGEIWQSATPAATNYYEDVAGSGLNSQGVQHAFFWNPRAKFVTTSIKKPVLTDLGLLLNGTYTQATGIANNGQVVGYGDYSATAPNQDPHSHAFYWNPTGGGLIDLNSSITNNNCPPNYSGGCNSYALGTNNVGQIVGYANDSTGATFGFIYSPSAALVKIPNFQATAINSAGVVVGEDITNPSAPVPSEYVGGVLKHLYLPSNDASGSALAINDTNQIVGFVEDSAGDSQAVAWVARTTTDTNGFVVLGGTGATGSGVLQSGNIAEATGIDDSGYVVGYSNLTNGGSTNDAFSAKLVATAAGSLTPVNDIGLSANGSAATAISRLGKVVGISNENSSTTASVWATPLVTTPATPIGPLEGGTPTFALGVNYYGEVAGYGYTSTGEQDAFFWNPAQLVVTVTVTL